MTPRKMPSGIAIAAAISVASVVRSTVRMKSKPSRPPAMPFHSARNVSVGDGSSTGSTTRYQTARYQMTIRPTTPMTGRKGSRRMRLIPCAPRAGTPRGSAP